MLRGGARAAAQRIAEPARRHTAHHFAYHPLTPNPLCAQWYAFHSHLVNYQWTGGFVAGHEIVEEAKFFIASGLKAAGYK